jgi:hypothetical protein
MPGESAMGDGATGAGGSGVLIGGLISAAILKQFEPVTSSLLAKRQLLRRTDTKFLTSRGIVEDLLGDVTATYGILKAKEEPLPLYRTLYFDTESLRCFHDHRRGRRPRHKVRIRHYPDREVSFLEVKTKRNERLTIKHRRRVPFDEDDLTPEDLAFVSQHCDLPAAELIPQVWTNFRRLTLVGFETNERVTIDMDVHFVRDNDEVKMPDLAIVEINQTPGEYL